MKHNAKPFAIITAAVALGTLALWAANPSAPAREPVDVKRDTSPLNRENSAVFTSYAPVLDRATPAVVSITVERKLTQRMRGRSRNDMLEELMRRMWGLPPRREERREAPQEPEDRERFVPEGMGSGFIVSPDGYVLTNNHVVRGQSDSTDDEAFDVKRITVSTKDGRQFEAEVVGTDPSTDLAVLKVDADGLPFVTLGDSTQIAVGDIVFAIGNPLRVGLTVSQGIVSAVNRTDLGIIDQSLMRGGANFAESPPIESFIQTDAAINLGNSGGPLLDAQGRVIGINSAISSIGGGSIGIGFAIPINLAEQVMQSIVTGGDVRRGFIGVGLESLTLEKARAFGLDRVKGAIVNDVQKGLPGDRAGLKRGDIILSVDGEQVDSVRDLIYLISSRSPGTTVTLGIFRYGERQNLEVELGDREELVAGRARTSTGGGAFGSGEAETNELVAGLAVRPLKQREREAYELTGNDIGILVTSVETSPEWKTTLRPGMVILEINGEPVSSIDSARAALNDQRNAVFALDDDGRRSFHWILRAD